MNDIIKFNRSFDPDFWHRLYVNPYNIKYSKDMKTKHVSNDNCPQLLDHRLIRLKHHFPDQVWIGHDCDPYPAAERHYRITRRTIEVLAIHICSLVLLTRSPLVLRDIDLIREIHLPSQTTVIVSTPSMKAKTVQSIEPYKPTLKNRIYTMLRLRRSGVHTGIMIAPLISGVNDQPNEVELIFRRSAEYNLDFVLFPNVLNQPKYKTDSIKDMQWRILELSYKYKMPLRIKRYCPPDYRHENYWLAARLADLAYCRRLKGSSFQPFMRAARRINSLKSDVRNLIRQGLLFEQSCIEKAIHPRLNDLLTGCWAGPNVDWNWLYESL